MLPADEPFYAIRRTDGEPLMGEYSWLVCDGPDDWTVAEEGDHWDPVEYEIVLMTPTRMATRLYGAEPPTIDDDDDLRERPDHA